MKKPTITEFEETINKYSRMLSKIAYSYTKNIFDTQDIVQEVFIKFYNARNSFESEDHIKNWLIRVTINKSIDVLKYSNKKKLIDDEHVNNLQSTNDFGQKSVDLYDCVCSLKENYKTIITLYYYDNCNISEIAGILKISEGSVRTRLSRARVKLKEVINKRQENGK